MSSDRRKLGKLLSIMPRWYDYLLTAAILAAACIISIIIVSVDEESYVQLVFVLAVALVSRFTNGYLCGLMFSFIGMFAVNYAFTYPYFKVDFSYAGYSVTFSVMLIVSVMICMLTTQLKEQARIKTEMEKEKMRGNLLRSVSHDIRTPLTSISGAASAIAENMDKLDDKALMELVTDIKDDAEWLIRMVENILTVTRIGDETGTLCKNPEAAEEIISEAIIKFRKRYSIPVEITIPDELLLIPMDAILIEQVIINILENSVIHGKGATHITLSLAKDGEEAVFKIADNGCGIEKELIPKLFDGYMLHGDNGYGDAKRNMSIGLSVCSTIISAHGGTLKAENQHDGGAVFIFRLPLNDI